jgi:BolA family transcriptional regulator, general stress-responsive regulator
LTAADKRAECRARLRKRWPDWDLTEARVTRAERLEQVLAAALEPSSIAVVDESHRHAGHAGARAEGETHYAVEIVSQKFVGMTRIQRHRLVHEIVLDEFDKGLHALSLKLLAPNEMPRRDA